MKVQGEQKVQGEGGVTLEPKPASCWAFLGVFSSLFSSSSIVHFYLKLLSTVFGVSTLTLLENMASLISL